MSSIPRLIESTLDDFGLLARQYAQLSALKVKKSSRFGVISIVMLSAAGSLLVVAFAELIFSLSAIIVDYQQLSQMTLISAGITTMLSVIFAGIGKSALKKIDLDPRSSVGLLPPDIESPFKQLKARGI
jgi:hypothetical protein